MRPSSIQWRLGLIASGAAAGSIVLLAFLVALAIAAAMEDQVAAYILAIMSIVAAVLCLLAVGVFSLDALQVKGQVLASVSSAYTNASVWVIVKLVLSTIIFLVLALSAFRAARAMSRGAAARTPVSNRAPMVVGTPKASS
jgi:hypothetical protein